MLKDHPTLKLCVPHLGADEFDAYARLLERYDNLWLDTTMAVAGYFPMALPARLLHVRPERILYGTDFPNIPYAWDRELDSCWPSSSGTRWRQASWGRTPWDFSRGVEKLADPFRNGEAIPILPPIESAFPTGRRSEAPPCPTSWSSMTTRATAR